MESGADLPTADRVGASIAKPGRSSFALNFIFIYLHISFRMLIDIN